jgi:hypothetical protein
VTASLSAVTNTGGAGVLLPLLSMLKDTHTYRNTHTQTQLNVRRRTEEEEGRRRLGGEEEEEEEEELREDRRLEKNGYICSKT